MEQTSMTNAIKKRLNKKGFTLAEVLVTVAIILILAGVTFVSVAQYQKNLRLMEMDGTAKEIFIAAQNHLSVAKASGDLDRLAGGTSTSTIGTKLSPAPSYASNTDGEYYYVIHNVTSGSESYTPSGSDAILQMMLPFGALDETVATGGNYAIVYELKSASVVAVLYSGAGNASFGNAAVINFSDKDVSNIKDIYKDKSARKNYQKGDVTAIVGCYTGTAGSAAIPTETLEAPKLEVKNENKLHVIVSDTDKTAGTDNVTLIIRGVQSGTVAQRLLQRDTSDGHIGAGAFDVTIDDITGDDGSYRFTNIISSGRFTKTEGDEFIPGENIEISARVSSKTGLATPKESAKYTVSSLFGDANETKDAAGNTTVYIRNLRHLENLGANVSGFTAALGTGTTSGSSKIVNIIAEQKNDITMFSMSTSGVPSGNHFENLYGSKIYGMEQEATFAAIDVNYPLVYHGNQHEIHDVSIGAQTGYTAAGIFGQVADPASGEANASLSVRDLILRNDRVSGTNVRNAGMLVGETTKDLTVDGVLAYYHEDTYDETKDSNVEVTASENAGGLIGLVAGGKLSVKNSAAAVYVKGGSTAGGFIGSVSGVAEGSTIVQSYAGGHTRDGAYDTEIENKVPKNQGAGRYNVQASGYAGGFIGVTTNQVQMDNVYATMSVYSSNYSDSNKCSGSFDGTGTLSIPAKAEKDGSTKKHYYALGPHNGVDATKEELACAELAQGQAHRQATPYDRKLVLKDKETAHPKMDKISYPLCTVRNLCEEDTSVKDTDLPWFIKEHIGDWVVHKEHGKAGFEIENGNRLTVRINTGLASITQPLLYKIKIHGESSNQDIYFNVEVKPDNTVTVKREYSNWGLFDISEIAECVTLDGTQAVQFYLDDITRENGHFYTVCAELLWPGEDITVNVASAEIPADNSGRYKADFKDENQLRTNSLFGYLEKSGKAEGDKHNSQKISAVKTYYPNAGVETGLGLVPVKDEYGDACYYAQIDNSRHLENLSSPIAYKSKTEICKRIIGAIQTDNIYWKGWDEKNTKDTFTEGFIEELGQNHTVNVYDDKGENILASSNHFSPISYNEKLKMYDGSGFKISGLDAVEQNGYAALFTQIVSAVTIKKLVLENASFKSDSQYTAGLIAYAGAAVDIDKVKFTGCLNINGSKTAAGFVAFAANSITIDNSGIENGIINSANDKAAGLVANAGQAATISNVKCIGNLNVSGYSETGGFVGRAENSITVTDSDIENGKISSTNGDAAGIVSYAGQSATIDKVNCTGALVIKGQNKAAGFAAQAANSITITNSGIENGNVSSTDGDAAGLISYAGQSATIKKVNCTGRLNIIGKKQAAGFVAQAANGITITDSGIEEGTVYSSESNAGGLIGYAAGDSTLSNITWGNNDSNKKDLNGEFRVQSNGKNWQNASAGGLIARATGVPTIKNVHFNLMLTVENTNNDISNAEQDAVGGLIGCATAKTDIEDSSITNGLIKSIVTRAGGFVGCGQNDIIIKNSNIYTIVVSSTKAYSGGFVGAADGYFDINNTGLLADSMITSSESDAGGVVGHAKSGVNITNTKIIGSNTEIIAKTGNAGGLIGGFENSGLTISNSAVSAFVNSKNGNAGGLIGNMNGAAEGSKINNSFYGGRTVKAAYGTSIVYKGTVYEHSYAANIIAKNSAGGLIGSISDGKNLTLIRSFSTGSVQAETGSIGGFIGYIGTAGDKNGTDKMNIQECYSIGAVTSIGDNPNRSVGGFIGKTSDGVPAFNSSYYLNWFNSPMLKAIGNDTLGKYNSIAIDNEEAILGKTESQDLTSEENTHFYDETLAGRHYTYKNWTSDGQMNTYYGDWPLQKNLVGEFVYFHAISSNRDEYKTGGYFKIAGYETKFDGYLGPQNTDLPVSGFGIFSDMLFYNDDDYYKIKDRFKWSPNISGPFDGSCAFEGKNAKKYSVVYYQGKNYYFYRCTSDELEKVENGIFYVKDTEKNLYYKIDVNAGNATFEQYSLPAD